MASTLVETLPSIERTLLKVDDSQHMSVDDLCLSVQSISLTETSVEKVIEQIVKDRENTTAKHRGIDPPDEDETNIIDGQLPELDVGQIVTASVTNQTEEAPVSCLEQVRKGETQKSEKISLDLRKRNEEDKEGLLPLGVEKGDNTGLAKQREGGIRSPGLRQCIPQEHDEATNELIAETKDSVEVASELVSHGPRPPGGIPVLPEYNEAVLQPFCFDPQAQVYSQYGGLADSYENAPKYRKPQPEYVSPFTYTNPPDIALLSGGNVSVYNRGHELEGAAGFHGGMLPSQHELMVSSHVIDLADNDVNNVVSEFLATPVISSFVDSGDFDGIMNSASDDHVSESLPVPTIVPANTPGISADVGNGFAEFLAPVSPVRSPMFDGHSDCISPGFPWSPENPPMSSAMSPTSTADSGLDEELDNILEYITEDLHRNHVNRDPIRRARSESDNCCLDHFQHQRHASGSDCNSPCVGQHANGNPYLGNPGTGNSIVGNPRFPNFAPVDLPVQNTTVPVISTVVQLAPSDTVSTVIATPGSVPQGQGLVTCVLVSNVPPLPVPAIATPSRKTGYREILPRPPDIQKENFGSQVSACAAAGPRSLPPFIPEPEPMPMSESADHDKKMQIYRAVSGFTTQQIIHQDDDGDTSLHLMVARHNDTVVDALIRRLERDGILRQALCIRNLLHQTPLCLAVIANSPSLVRRLISVGSDVNVQLQRAQLNNMGVVCYRLIHCVAKKGLNWSHTLDELLAAPDIELDVADSEGCSALHCAIDAHDRLIHDCKIDSRRTIYQLIDKGANIAVKHSLNGKTPLHFVVEKKNADFLSWFLELVRYFAERQVASLENPRLTVAGLIRQTVNAPASNGATALHIAASLKMEASSAYHKTAILQLLLSHGAEFSARTDSKLRTELAKDPALAELVKNAASTNHHRT